MLMLDAVLAAVLMLIWLPWLLLMCCSYIKGAISRFTADKGSE